jgi:PTS system N-acetylglucosamine-specific IIC component
LNALGTLQKLGKGLVTSIAVLPAAVLLLWFGQPDLLNIPALADAGTAIFDNLPLLFAMGVAVGLSRDTGMAALSAAAGHVVFIRAFAAVDGNVGMGVLSGIVIGVMTATVHNRLPAIRFPEFVAFLGGRWFVAITNTVAAVALGLIFGAIWLPVQGWISTFGAWVGSLGIIGYAVYGAANRLLIPLGLHHILNSGVWFVVGDYPRAGGPLVHGDMSRFFAGDPTAGGYMAGYFPIMMFGLVGAAVAMYQEASAARRRAVGAILLSAALTSFALGITEPMEFTFMFAAPALFAVHALLTGVSFGVMAALGVRLGFGLSAGLFDFVVNYRLAARPLLLIPVGLAFGVVYYLVFRVAIRRFNLPTPGREPEEGHP